MRSDQVMLEVSVGYLRSKFQEVMFIYSKMNSQQLQHMFMYHFLKISIKDKIKRQIINMLPYKNLETYLLLACIPSTV